MNYPAINFRYSKYRLINVDSVFGMKFFVDNNSKTISLKNSVPSALHAKQSIPVAYLASNVSEH